MKKNKIEKNVCELFAGVGGFRIGLGESGWKTVFVNQWEPKAGKQHAYNCYRKHFGEIGAYDNVDISKVPVGKIPKHTLLVGGFPCQDYSVARTRAEGIQGKKGVLWWDIARIIEKKNPPFILLENVDRLLKSPSQQKGRDFGVMLATFERFGYLVEWRVINAADYGFPQRRRRTFIFATHKNTKRYKELGKISPENILQKEGFFAQTFPINQNVEKIKTANFGLIKSEDEVLTVSNSFSFGFENGGIMHNGIITTGHVSPKFFQGKTLLALLDPEAGRNYDIDKKDMPIWETMKGAKRIERVSKSGYKYVFSEGKIAFPDPVDKPARTMLTSEGKKNRSTHIIKDPVTNSLRKITPLECERINGFPDNWTRGEMPESFRYFCMGNALVVGLIAEMGKKLAVIVDYENK